MTSRRRGAVAGRTLLAPVLRAALAVLVLMVAACSDGTPEFCAPLSEASDLGALADALREAEVVFSLVTADNAQAAASAAASTCSNCTWRTAICCPPSSRR